MPELPEVETLKRGLSKYLVGHTVKEIDIRLPKIFSGEKSNLIGSKIKDVRRFGKGLVIDFTNNFSLAIHIKLTGQLVYRGADEPKRIDVDMSRVGKTLPNNWTHVIFHLDKGAFLYYNDLRQFGWLKIVSTEKVHDLSFFKELGPEFFKDLTQEKFIDILSKSKTVVKPLIMDQKKMGGIGNIYANDGLYLAKIDPHRRASSLAKEEAKKLFASLETVLKKGIEEGGASELTFVNALGEAGHYQEHSLVYGHENEKCKRDGNIIIKEMLGGRGTYWCSSCQK